MPEDRGRSGEGFAHALWLCAGPNLALGAMQWLRLSHDHRGPAAESMRGMRRSALWRVLPGVADTSHLPDPRSSVFIRGKVFLVTPPAAPAWDPLPQRAGPAECLPAER